MLTSEMDGPYAYKTLNSIKDFKILRENNLQEEITTYDTIITFPFKYVLSMCRYVGILYNF